MRKFILRFLLFLIPIVIVLCFMKFYLHKIPNIYKYKHEWMLKNAKQVDCLVFGSSHTLTGIKPDLLSENTFSLANNMQPLYIDRDLLFKYEQYYDSLHTVIVPISYTSLFAPSPQKAMKQFKEIYYNYIIYMDLPSYKRYDIEKYFEIALGGKNALNKIIAHLKNNDDMCDEKGWLSLRIEKKNMSKWNEKEGAFTAKEHYWGVDKSKYLNYNLNALKEIFQFCKDKNIKIVLITTPCHHYYTDNLDKEQLKKMDEEMDKFVSETKVNYFNFLYDKRFDDDDFYNVDHLSDLGAEKFTKILKHKIDSID